MKTNIFICKLLLLGLIGVSIHACSDDFLTKNKEGYILETTLYVFPGKSAEMSPIVWAEAGNATFTITSMPDWLKVESMTGQFQNGIAELTCSAIKNESFTEPVIYIATMDIEVDGVGKCFVNVGYVNNDDPFINTGNPSFYCEVGEPIDFGRTETQQSINIYNNGSGALIWKVKKCPEWITVTSQGVVMPYEPKMITITCNRSGLSSGNHVGTITFSTNDKNVPTYTITVRCRMGTNNSTNVVAIDGWVKDAEYDKTTDILYFITQTPNKLVAYNTKSKTVVADIALSKAPTCVSIAENGQAAAVGHGGWLSYVDLSTKSVKTTFEIEFTIYDLILNNNNWCCMTKADGSHTSLTWINIETGEKTTGSDTELYGQSIIKKVPGQNIAIATRLQLGPSGIIIYDTQTKAFVKYFHQSIGRFWLSEDGLYLFDEYMNVYRTPSASTQSDPQPIGKLQEPKKNTGYYGSFYLAWLDHCVQTNHLWALEYDNWYSSPRTPNTLVQYEANDYTYLNTYFYDDYNTTIDGKTDLYPTSAHYVFANSKGSEVYVIKNVADEYYANAWSMEWIEVK